MTRSRSTPDRVLIGAHVPTRGGLIGAIDSAKACGADAAQIWGSNPRAWAHPSVDDSLRRQFVEGWQKAGLGPLFIHSPYMVNVASPNRDFRRRSVELARATVALAEDIEARGVVVHAGAGGADTPRPTAVRAAAGSLRSIAEECDATRLLVELTAGGAGSVASTFAEAGELFDAAGGDQRLALCVDTCHLFARGYELDSGDGVAACFGELRDLRLDGALELVHANDSMYERGRRRDSHTHIGEGRIGEHGFRAILADASVRQCPVLCETPGRLEDHARNIATLRRLSTVV
ncbi:MAG: deoxyribonuclease IV [Actinomycetota bacterium]|nr:deoxyribonuclease IV [Actinomycetota bacterium]